MNSRQHIHWKMKRAVKSQFLPCGTQSFSEAASLSSQSSETTYEEVTGATTSSMLSSADEILFSNKDKIADYENYATKHFDQNDKSFEQKSFAEAIEEWAVEYKVTQVAFTALLHIFKDYNIGNLPKDARTVLKTPRRVDVSEISGGDHIHFDISQRIYNILEKVDTTFLDCIYIQANIDGLPLAKSTKSELWPILIKLQLCDLQFIVPISIFHGKGKPKSLDFLKKFVSDINVLLSEGIMYGDKHFPIIFNAIICDAPAKAFVTGIKSFSGYFGCSKCTVEGDYRNGRMCFLETNSPLSDDCSFRERKQAEHHIGISPFEDITLLNMVNSFPLDYMHLVCLGVVRKLIVMWKRGSKKFRLPTEKILQLSIHLESIQSCVPSEFARKPRSILELDRWKATEFRQFLLYTGPVILRDILNSDMYLNFLILHCAISIL